MSYYYTCASYIVQLPQALVASHRAQPCLFGTSKSVDEMAADAGWDIRVVAAKYWKIKIDEVVRRRVLGEGCYFYDRHVHVTCHTVGLNVNCILAPSHMSRAICVYE